MDKLNINLLGNVEIYYNDELINNKLSAKSIGVLAILLCNEHKKVTREKLAYMFWPESFETANYNLRYNLWNLKKVIPNDENNNEFIISDNKYCYINQDYNFSSDITYLENINKEKSSDINTLKKVKELFRGEFLENFYFKECDDFNDWIFYQRSIFQKLHIQTLNKLLDQYLNLNVYESAKDTLEEILLINPYDEESHYKLMNLLINNNESNLAIIHYKKYQTSLREDLNIFPQKKIKDLYLKLINNKNNEEINHSNKVSKDGNNIIIRINEYADSSVNYFAMSDLLEKLMLNFKKNILQGIPKIYLCDACLIQPSFYDLVNNYSNTELIEIRLYHSVKNILTYLSKDFLIQIYIYNVDKIDEKSTKFFKFLSSNTNLFIKYIEDEN
ncbi:MULTISPECIES: AfsR/SARP family transcriptional regulator [unclassified Sedimentibacter]|uniref:AfsR/SARP family transcriptional regulator n=1 Tax=unclassified Sedimentibacter TaxID=2649220 RepID=UPI0027E1D50D|nr:BTAD domain-containing putative transcriptional regulator [Sedimentibacter sp. MB35-C1]WMJ78200.1 BTAD domain-containing putative transcriptional regulator [Sedimentibacter sp. MB35-C1]